MGQQVHVVAGLSEISGDLGLVTAGEFRVHALGNTADPGKGFTGTRVSGAPMTYGARTVHVAGVNNDTLQVGFNSSDGTLYAINVDISGTITATAGAIGGWAIGATSLSSGSITLDSATPSIEIGAATDYLTGIGIFLGLNAGAYKFHVGDPVGNYIAWDGSALGTGGQWIHGTDNIEALSITAASIAASTITAVKLSVTSLDAITANMGALTVDGLLTMSGANGAITIGTTPPTSATVGTGLWIDRNGVISLSANVQNATLTSAGLSAGGGAVKVDVNGISIGYASPVGSANKLTFLDPGGASDAEIYLGSPDATADLVIDPVGGGKVYINSNLSASAITGVSVAVSGNLQTTAGFLGVGVPTELTIAAGVVTATGSFHSIDTEADAATDNLDPINGGSEGGILVLKSENNARDTTAKDGTGNLVLAGDFIFTHRNDRLTLIRDVGGWAEISRSDNA